MPTSSTREVGVVKAYRDPSRPVSSATLWLRIDNSMGEG